MNRQLEKCLHLVDMEKNLSQFMLFFATSVLLPITLFCREIYFVAVYAHLRGENIEPKNVSVEKKGQISSMHHTKSSI